MLGTAVSAIALPILVYQLTKSATLTGLLFALRVLPYLLVGLIAGPIADRGNRRLLIIGGNLVEGALVASVPIAALFDVLTVAQIYVVTLGSATMFVFSDAAVFGAVPALVGTKRLPAANGFLSALQSGSEIAGPAIAAIPIPRIAMGSRRCELEALPDLVSLAVRAPDHRRRTVPNQAARVAEMRNSSRPPDADGAMELQVAPVGLCNYDTSVANTTGKVRVSSSS